jgi:hypothetical protein
MKNKVGFILIIASIISFFACDNGTTNNGTTSNSNKNDIQGSFFIGNEKVSFYANNSDSISRSITDDSALSFIGKLKHNDNIIKISGYFIPNEKIFSISAGREGFHYVINGELGTDLSVKNANAVIQKKSLDNWSSIDNIPITFGNINIVGDYEDNYENKIKEQFLGQWILIEEEDDNLPEILLIQCGVITTLMRISANMRILELYFYQDWIYHVETDLTNINLSEFNLITGIETKEEAIIFYINQINSQTNSNVIRNNDILFWSIPFEKNEFFPREIEVLDDNTISVSYYNPVSPINSLPYESTCICKIVNGRLEVIETITGLTPEPTEQITVWVRP